MFQIRSYLTYWLDAVDAHSLHSPFFFDFHEKVLKGKDTLDYSVIETLRSKLLDNPTPLSSTDLGAGPKRPKRERTIAEVARTSLSPKKFSSLYARVVQYYQPRNVIELGTSLGINAVYLACPSPVRVTTFEGSSAIASVARSTFEFANAENIRLIEGNIDATLPEWLDQNERVDLAFMDANHRYEPTLRYFEMIQRRTHPKSIVILDDIHYTAEMERAWQLIRDHPMVYGSIDLYRAGIVFFDPSLNKQHVVLQF